MKKSKEENKDKNNKDKNAKLKKILSIDLSCLLILLSIIYLVFFFTHKDPNRNPNIKEDNSNISLVEKNLIDGFKDTSLTGKYSFNLPDKDINQILLNSNEDLLWKHAESMYYTSSEDEHHIYIDIKKTLAVNTRVDISLIKVEETNNLTRVFDISSRRMGSLKYVREPLELESYVKELSNRSYLPITYNTSTKYIEVSPLNLLEYFPNEYIKSSLKELINLKPECVELDPNSIFGFSINLSLFKDELIPLKEVSDGNVNLEDIVRSSITTEFLNSIPVEESKKACSLTVKDINNVLSSKFFIGVKEHAESTLTSTKVDVGIEDIYLVLEDTSHLSIVITFSFNGYKIYFKNNVLMTCYPFYTSNLEMDIYLGVELTLKDMNISKPSSLGTLIYSKLDELLGELSDSYSYLSYEPSSTKLKFDFDYITSDIVGFDFYEGYIKTNMNEDKGFDIIIVRI